MNILHCITSLEQGGAQAVLYELINGMPQHRHTILFMYDGPYKNKFHALGIKTIQLSGSLHVYDMSILYHAYQLCKQINPDLIHSVLWLSHMIIPVVARMLGVPCINALHNNVSHNGVLRIALARVCGVRPTKNIAVSDDVKKSFCAARLIDEKSVHVISNGVAVQKKHDTHALRQQLGLHEDEIVLGAVGRFIESKRFILTLDAFAVFIKTYGRAKLIIIGVGAQEDTLRAHVKKRGMQDNVIFLINQDAAPYYQVFDIFLQTSASEGVSIALLQAMAAECVCIITHKSMQHPVITHEKNGYIIRESDASIIADTLKKIVHDRSAHIQMCSNAHETIVQNFSLEHMVRAYETCFLECVNHMV